jgi:hypothetical protein
MRDRRQDAQHRQRTRGHVPCGMQLRIRRQRGGAQGIDPRLRRDRKALAAKLAVDRTRGEETAAGIGPVIELRARRRGDVRFAGESGSS